MSVEPAKYYSHLPCPPHEVYRFVLTPVDELELPAYAGSAFRGLFGHALRRVTCALRGERCPSCLVRGSCTYHRMFETAVDPEEGPKPGVNRAPHPYVLVPPLNGGRLYRPGDTMTCELLLMGPARGTLPYLAYTFQEMGRMGLTRARRRFELVRVEALGSGGWQPVYVPEEATLRVAAVEAPPPLLWVDGTNRVALRLVTPLRIKSGGRLLREFSVTAFLTALARRWMDLMRYYGEGVDEELLHELLDLRGRVAVVRSHVSWQDYTRYSNRQQTRMQLGGLTGGVVLEGAVDDLAWWLAWAERFHVGKATGFGFGKVAVLRTEEGGACAGTSIS